MRKEVEIMEGLKFRVETDGFYGVYWGSMNNSVEDENAIILLIGDDPEDYMARCGVKWLQEKGINVLTMSPGKKDYAHHNYPLERVEKAIEWLKENGMSKVGIVGASTTGTLALTAASYFEDISLTIALTPSDFIWQGFERGKRDGAKEWPADGESLFTYRGEPLPYLKFKYQHPDYWNIMMDEAKKSGDFINSKRVFDDSEAAYPLSEDQMIKIENIKGKLLVIGSEDDVLWDTARYIRRMEARMNSHEHECEFEPVIYEHATHFVFPEGLMKKMLPVGSGLFPKVCFKSAREHGEEGKAARIDIDKRINSAIETWK